MSCVLLLYSKLSIISSLLRKWTKLPEVALYMDNMEILCEVSDTLTVHTSLSRSSENFLKSTLIKFRFLLTKLHDPPILKEFLQNEAPKV